MQQEAGVTAEQIIPAQRADHQPSGAEVLRASLQTHKN